MLNSKQRAKLRSIASTIQATTIMGKDGLTETVLAQIDRELTARELVKVSVLENAEETPLNQDPQTIEPAQDESLEEVVAEEIIIEETTIEETPTISNVEDERPILQEELLTQDETKSNTTEIIVTDSEDNENE